MATVTPVDAIGQIGETAGLIWQHLEDNGPVAMTKLIKAIDAPRDQVNQALGWLAREDKITIVEEKRKKIVSLV